MTDMVSSQTDVFFVDHNGALNVAWVTGSGAWQGPAAISPPGVAPAGSAIAPSAQYGVDGQTDVFFVDHNGALNVAWVTGSGAWQGPAAISPPGVAPAPAAVAASAQYPQSVRLQQNIETPSGTALGGFAAVTLRSDGTYSFVTHLHDSGLDSYSFQVRVTLTTATGVRFTAQHSGSVGGTLGGGSRDDEHTENGFQQWIRDNWSGACTAAISVSKSYQDTGLIGVGEEGLKDLLTFIGVDLVAGSEIALIVTLGRELESLTGVAVGGPGVLPGVLVASGAAFLLGPSMIFPAIVAGVAVGAVTDALIKFRRMADAERAEADKVFAGQIPYGLVWLTNLSASNGRKFTWPSVDNSILVNLGDAYDDPSQYADPNSGYQQPGEVFIHELTHAWQIAHTSFSPGLACERIIDPSYAFGPPGPPFSSFTIEGQAQIVDYWYGGDRREADGHPHGTGKPMDPNDPYFGYIENNIRIGVG